MADRVPVRLDPTSGTRTAISAFQPGETVGVPYGGTGAITPAGARIKLGLEIGADIAAYVLHNLTATTDPTVTDDNTLGYEDGLSIWLNTVTNDVFHLADGATGAAVWTSATIQSMSEVPNANKLGTPIHIDRLDEIFDHMYSSGIADGAVITNNLDGTIGVSSGECFIRAVASGHETLYSAQFTGTESIALTDNATNYVYVDYNAGAPNIGVTLDPTTVNLTTLVPVAIVVREGTGLSIMDIGDDSIDANAKLRQRIFYTEPMARANGGAISSPSSLYLACSAGSFWFGLQAVPLPALNTSGADTFEYYYYNPTTLLWVESDQSLLSNTSYNDTVTGTGLVALATNKYRADTVYAIMATEGNTHYAVVYGQAQYNSIAEAEDAPLPSIVPPSVDSPLAVLLGKVVVRQAEPTPASILSAFSTTLTAAQVSQHNGLSGLQGGTTAEYYHMTDAEYTQYGYHLRGRSTAAPNATIPVHSIAATGAETNIDAALIPKGIGALVAAISDNAVAGGNKRGQYAVDLQRNRGFAEEVASGASSVIAGGAYNRATGELSTIAGGDGGVASGDWSTISGGGGGLASGDYSTVGGGTACTASGISATVGGGSSVRATAPYATAGGGDRNLADGNSSTIPGGAYATTRQIHGQFSYAAKGIDSITGKSQLGTLPVIAITTDATPVIATSNGNAVAGTNITNIPNNYNYSVKITVVAKNVADSTEMASWVLEAVVGVGSGPLTIYQVGNTVKSTLAKTTGAASWDVAIQLNTTYGAVVLQVTGETAKTINWLAKIDTIEVG